MVKHHKRSISILLSIMLVVSMCCLPASMVSAATTPTAEVTSAGTKGSTTPAETGKYSTNANGKVGKKATISIDGEFNDWSDDMLIAQGAAWDVANHWKGGHENCVLDTYSLYGAWDDENLYVAWQMVNTTDTWAREGDGPLSDGGRVLDVPLILALSVDPNSVSMTNKNTDGNSIWGQKMGIEFSTHVDRLLYMSGKPGMGEPSIFKAADAQGNTNYVEPNCVGFLDGGISYKMKEGFLPSTLIGLNSSDSPSDIYDESADWVDYLTYTGAQGKHNTTYDSFYEIKIPLSLLDVDADYIAQYGIGAMLLATRGESALDCIPHDPSMIDNALDSYGADASTSHEKDDIDNITVPLASIGGSSDGPIPTKPPTQPSTPTEPSTPTDPPTTPTTPTGPITDGPVTGSTTVNVKAGDTVEYKISLKSQDLIKGFKLSAFYDNNALRLDTSYGQEGLDTPNFNSSVVVNSMLTSAGGKLVAVGAVDVYETLANFKTEKDMAVIKFTALKDTTTNLSYLFNDVRGEAEVNLFDTATGQPISSTLSTASKAVTTGGGIIPTNPDVEGKTGSTSVHVKAGDIVEYKVTLKDKDLLAGFNLRAFYDNSELKLDTTFGQEGLTAPNFAGSLVVNGSGLVSEGRVAAVGSAGEDNLGDYTAETDLVVLRFIALKDTTTTLSYTIKDLRGVDNVNMFDQTGKPISSSVSTANTATVLGDQPTIPTSNNGDPVTGSKTVDVTEGDVIRYEVFFKTPAELYGWNMSMSYDDTKLAIDNTFGEDGIAVNEGIPYALGEETDVDYAVDGDTLCNPGTKNTVSAASGRFEGYKGYADGQKSMVVQFVAKQTGSVTLTYFVKQQVGMDDVDYADPGESGQLINGSMSDSEIIFVKQKPTDPPTTPTDPPTTPTIPTTPTEPPTTPTNPSEAPTLPEKTEDDEFVTGGKVVKVHAGDTVTYEINYQANEPVQGIVAYAFFNKDILELDTDFGTNGAQYGVRFDKNVLSNPASHRISLVQSNNAPEKLFEQEKNILTIKFKVKADGYATIYYSINEILAGADMDNQFTYYYLGKETVPGSTLTDKAIVDCPHPDVLMGDVNFDGVVDMRDVLIIQRAYSKLFELTEEEKKVADVTRDGIVDLYDIVRIRQYVAEYITSLD